MPDDVLVSGNPCDLDGIPLFAKRMVLFSCERPRSDALAMDTLLAYYAADPETVAAYCRQYGVDYLVVNQDSFEPVALAAGARHPAAPVTEGDISVSVCIDVVVVSGTV